MFKHIGIKLSVVLGEIEGMVKDLRTDAEVKLLKSSLFYSLTTLHIIKLSDVVVVLEAVKYEAV